MAKTTEQLLQQAVQIRDEQANKKNTALRVGTLFSDIIEKQEESDQTHATDVTKINEAVTENREKVTNLNKNTGISGYPVWKPNTAYAKGVVILNPDGQLVKNTVEQLDSGGTYNPVLWETTSLDKENREKVAELEGKIGYYQIEREIISTNVILIESIYIPKGGTFKFMLSGDFNASRIVLSNGILTGADKILQDSCQKDKEYIISTNQDINSIHLYLLNDNITYGSVNFTFYSGSYFTLDNTVGSFKEKHKALAPSVEILEQNTGLLLSGIDGKINTYKGYCWSSDGKLKYYNENWSASPIISIDNFINSIIILSSAVSSSVEAKICSVAFFDSTRTFISCIYNSVDHFSKESFPVGTKYLSFSFFEKESVTACDYDYIKSFYNYALRHAVFDEGIKNISIYKNISANTPFYVMLSGDFNATRIVLSNGILTGSDKILQDNCQKGKFYLIEPQSSINDLQVFLMGDDITYGTCKIILFSKDSVYGVFLPLLSDNEKIKELESKIQILETKVQELETNNNLYNIIVDLPVSDGSDLNAGSAYIDSNDNVVKVKL